MNRYRVAHGGESYDVTVIRRDASSITFEIEGKVHTVEVTRTHQLFTHMSGAAISPAPVNAAVAISKSTAPGLVAPMPGIIVNVLTEPGAEVAAGATLVVMEAMKMENNLSAPRAGRVKAVHVKKGEEVNGGQLLVELE